jgi:hypothetical protein
LLTEGLVAAGHHVMLFATADSITTATLRATALCGWSEDATTDAKAAECLHIASVFECAGEFDIITTGSTSCRSRIAIWWRIHPDKGTADAIEVARRCGRRLDIAGIIQDEEYFRNEVAPTSTASTSATSAPLMPLRAPMYWAARTPCST